MQKAGREPCKKTLQKKENSQLRHQQTGVGRRKKYSISWEEHSAFFGGIIWGLQNIGRKEVFDTKSRERENPLME